MSEVALPSAFVDETSFKEFNSSFDTDDPLLNGDFDYTDSIEEITHFMNDATVKENGKEPDDDPNEQQPRTTTPPANFRLLTKGTSPHNFYVLNALQFSHLLILHTFTYKVGINLLITTKTTPLHRSNKERTNTMPRCTL